MSVVIAGVSGDRAVEHCLASLQRSARNSDIEVIVLRGNAQSVFQLRWQGIAQTSGDRIAVLGDRYEVTDHWLKTVLKGELAEVAAGCVVPATDLDYWGWCVYLTEYSHVAPSARPGEAVRTKLVPGGNVVYDARIVRKFPPGRLETDLSYHQRLLKAGVRIEVRDDLDVCYAQPPIIFESIRERFWFSRKIGGEGGPRKLLIAPLLPFVLLLRIASSVLQRRRFAARLLVSMPVIFLLGLVQGAGEFTGALASTKK